MKLNIAIIGYGMAGIAAAIHCRRLGHTITHYERRNQIISAGAGMLLHPPAQDQLKHLGVLDQALACGARVNSITAQTSTSKSLLNFNYAGRNKNQSGLGIQRAALHHILSNADEGNKNLKTSSVISAIDAEDGYLIENHTKRHGPYDLIIIADGMNSQLRKDIQPSVKHREVSSSIALVGLLDDPKQFISPQLTQYFKGTRHISIWPVGSFTPGAINKCGFAMNVTRSEASELRVNDMWQQHAATLYPGITTLLKQQESDIKLHSFTYRQLQLQHCFKGRAVMIGDASHSMSPQLGNGVQLALEDAALLANQIQQSTDLSTALSTYSRIRIRQLQPYHQASRLLTPLFQSDSQLLSAFRNTIFSRIMKAPKIQQLAHSLLG